MRRSRLLALVVILVVVLAGVARAEEVEQYIRAEVDTGTAYLFGNKFEPDPVIVLEAREGVAYINGYHYWPPYEVVYAEKRAFSPRDSLDQAIRQYQSSLEEQKLSPEEITAEVYQCYAESPLVEKVEPVDTGFFKVWYLDAKWWVLKGLFPRQAEEPPTAQDLAVAKIRGLERDLGKGLIVVLSDGYDLRLSNLNGVNLPDKVAAEIKAPRLLHKEGR